MKFSNAILVVSVACTGCASVMNESNHAVRVETKTESGQMVTGAECRLTNDYGTVNIKSGDSGLVHRSSKDLEIACKHPTNGDANGRAISRVNGGMFGNIIIGGGIGAVIDHSRGTAYTYPTWVQLVFGKTFLFDRNAEKEGQPTAGTEPVETK